MIISHKHKFIFIKTNKTAGTSIEIALSKFCGEDDIITPIASEDEKIRRNYGYRGPQNYEERVIRYRLPDVAKWLIRGQKKGRFYNHMPAREIKTLVGDNVWDDYFKFCFERNPWDKVISLYYWRGRDKKKSLSEFIASDEIMILKKHGRGCYTIDNRIVVDRVGKFENINKELEVIRKIIGIDESIQLPKAKSTTRKDKRSYRDLLSKQDRIIIENIFADEISAFDYSW